MDKNTNTRESQFIRFNWFIQSVGMYPTVQLICITNTSPIQSLSLMFGVGSLGLLGGGDRPISKTNAGQKSTNTNTIKSLFILFNWFIQSVGMYPMVQLILRDCCRLSSVAVYDLALRKPRTHREHIS